MSPLLRFDLFLPLRFNWPSLTGLFRLLKGSKRRQSDYCYLRHRNRSRFKRHYCPRLIAILVCESLLAFTQGRASVFQVRAIRVWLSASARTSSDWAQVLTYLVLNQGRWFSPSLVHSFIDILLTASALSRRIPLLKPRFVSLLVSFWIALI